MAGRDKRKDHLREGRRDRLIQEHVHDPYRAREKPPEPTVCPDCGAVFRDGRWSWSEAPENAHRQPCPACQRIRDRLPEAFVFLEGDFLAGHGAEIVNLIRNVEERERAEHPVKRVMAIEDGENGMQVSVTDHRLARGIGEALQSAYQGELDYQYQKGETLLRVQWRR